jgi:hypothetical protein
VTFNYQNRTICFPVFFNLPKRIFFISKKNFHYPESRFNTATLVSFPGTNDLTPGPSPWRRGEVVANQCVTKLFAIFLLSDITEIQTRLPYNTNHKYLVKRRISESTPLLQGEGAGGEVINDPAPQGVRSLMIHTPGEGSLISKKGRGNQIIFTCF